MTSASGGSASQLKNVVEFGKNEGRKPAVLNEVYRHLNANRTDVIAGLDALEEAWIWSSSNCFVNADKLLIKPLPVGDVTPHFDVISSSDVREYGELFRMCGVREEVTNIEVLRRISDEYEEGTTRDERPAKKDLRIAVSIIKELADQTEISGNFPADLPIPINTPDSTLNFKPLDQCTFCDEPEG